MVHNICYNFIINKTRGIYNEQRRTNCRYLYLRGLANGTIQGPPVGFPSIDMPWLKDYSEEEILSDIIPRRIYEEFKESCEKYKNLIAIEYF